MVEFCLSWVQTFKYFLFPYFFLCTRKVLTSKLHTSGKLHRPKFQMVAFFGIMLSLIRIFYQQNEMFDKHKYSRTSL